MPSILQSSYLLKQGQRPNGPRGVYDGTFVEDYEFVDGSGDLDRANGMFGPTNEYPNGTYYYVITETFPYIPRFFKGTPDESFKQLKKGPPPMRHRRHKPGYRRSFY